MANPGDIREIDIKDKNCRKIGVRQIICLGQNPAGDDVWASVGGGGGGGSCEYVRNGFSSRYSDNVSFLTCEQALDYIFQFTSQPPSVNIRATVAFGLYETGFSILNPQIEGRGQLGMNPVGSLTQLEFWRGSVGGTELNPDELGPTPNTWYSRADGTTITTDQTYTVRITDDQGRMNTASGQYRFAHPFFATTVDIVTLTKQALTLDTSSYFETDMVAETGGNKQTFDIRDTVSITGIQFYNTISSNWEWLGGSAANSLTQFTTSTTTHTVQGNVLNYTRFTHNQVTIGARQLRFYN